MDSDTDNEKEENYDDDDNNRVYIKQVIHHLHSCSPLADWFLGNP